MTRTSKKKKFTMGLVTAVAASLMVFGQVGAANAVVYAGTKGCAGTYGNLRVMTGGASSAKSSLPVHRSRTRTLPAEHAQ